MTVNMSKIKKKTVNGKTVIGGIVINPDKMRVEWKPQDLQENVYGVLGVIKKSYGRSFKFVGDIHKINQSDVWVLDYEYEG